MQCESGTSSASAPGPMLAHPPCECRAPPFRPSRVTAYVSPRLASPRLESTRLTSTGLDSYRWHSSFGRLALCPPSVPSRASTPSTRQLSAERRRRPLCFTPRRFTPRRTQVVWLHGAATGAQHSATGSVHIRRRGLRTSCMRTWPCALPGPPSALPTYLLT